MAGSVVQSVEAPSTGTTNVSTLTASFGSNMGSGNGIVIFATNSYDISAGGTFGDSKSNTYSLLATAIDTSGGGDTWTGLFYCRGATPLTTSDVITYTLSGTDYVGFKAHEVTGVTTAAAIAYSGNYQTGISGGSANAIFCGSLACGSGAVFLIGNGMMTTENTAAPWEPTVGTGFTLNSNWFNFTGSNLATVETENGTNLGTLTNGMTWSPQSGASGDSFVSLGLVLAQSTNSPSLIPTSGSETLSGVAPSMNLGITPGTTWHVKQALRERAERQALIDGHMNWR
ncbi:MAG: hypothetical protein KGL39_50780, partial [Patescibacteria group bacterium]|nr:hypothetical protein [Patescibacteria group bacterium]